MNGKYTCITCKVLFHEPELQREHYKSDWHRYNLKRKVANLAPVTLEEFNLRLKQHQELEKENEELRTMFCKCCSKSFNTKNAFDNHLNSKRHKIAEAIFKEGKSDNQDRSEKFSDSESFVKIEPKNTKQFVLLNEDKSDDEYVDTDSEVEELDSDEWDELRIKGSDSLIQPKECLFCAHQSRTMVKNLRHMLLAHSFFIPDVEYCCDISGLLLYLGEKISRGYMCLWCNEKGRTFYSMEAARSHMVSKGHCKMIHEGIALAEYAEFYDYSSSYPDQEEGEPMDADEEVETPQTLDSEDFQLVLPSGATIGHRSLMRYYKQNLPTTNAVVPVKKSERKLHKVLGQYRALGWAPQDQVSAARKAKDIHFMKRVQAKWQMKLSVKANKFQKHYRPQVNF